MKSARQTWIQVRNQAPDKEVGDKAWQQALKQVYDQAKYQVLNQVLDQVSDQFWYQE